MVKFHIAAQFVHPCGTTALHLTPSGMAQGAQPSQSSFRKASLVLFPTVWWPPSPPFFAPALTVPGPRSPLPWDATGSSDLTLENTHQGNESEEEPETQENKDHVLLHRESDAWFAEYMRRKCIQFRRN